MRKRSKFEEKYGKIFNIRVPPPKQAIIDEFKRLVDDRLHSDYCFVTTMLIEAFVKAFREVPEPTVIRLVKQDITIQQNCTNIYGTTLKRARRVVPPEHLIPVELPKCEVCGKPATRRYLYPNHGYMDLCVEHGARARGSLGFKDLTKVKPDLQVEITPTFPLEEPPKPVKPKSFLANAWRKVKQFLSKLVRSGK